jgi:NAD(P)-dependent dehydrogenase (short-subunit alcohol dehydrogenase family)
MWQRSADDTQMRVMIVGGTGLIGAALAARLRKKGHDILAVARQGTDVCHIDITSREFVPQLVGIDAVVNCAGVLQNSLTDSTDVHEGGSAISLPPADMPESAGLSICRHLESIETLQVNFRVPS